MLAHLTHRTPLFFTLMLLLTFAVTGSGCSSGAVYRAYDGAEQPLEEVAVLLLDKDRHVTLEQIDGNDISLLFDSECHLLPGIHSVKAHYTSVFGDAIGNPITLEHNFSKGCVYYLKADPVIRLVPAVREGELGTPLPPIWELKILYEGTIEEVASRRAKEWFSPTHWRKLAERQPPSSGRKDEQ